MRNPNERNRRTARFYEGGVWYEIHERSNKLHDNTWYTRRFVVRSHDNMHMGEAQGIRAGRLAVRQHQKDDTFVVFSVSTNTNSFGLHGVRIASARYGAFEIGKSDPPKVGTRLKLPVDERTGMVTSTPAFNFEIPKSLGHPPKAAMDEVYALGVPA